MPLEDPKLSSTFRVNLSNPLVKSSTRLSRKDIFNKVVAGCSSSGDEEICRNKYIVLDEKQRGKKTPEAADGHSRKSREGNPSLSDYSYQEVFPSQRCFNHLPTRPVKRGEPTTEPYVRKGHHPSATSTASLPRGAEGLDPILANLETSFEQK